MNDELRPLAGFLPDTELPIALAAQLCPLGRDSRRLAVRTRQCSLLVGAGILTSSVHPLGLVLMGLRGRLMPSLGVAIRISAIRSVTIFHATSAG